MRTAEFPAPAGFRLLGREDLRTAQDLPVRVVHPDPGIKLTFAPTQPMPGEWYEFELAFPPEGLVDVVAQFAFANERVLWLRLPVVGRNHFLGYFRLESEFKGLTLILTGSGRLNEPTRCRFTRIGLSGQLAAAARRGVEIFRRDGFRVVWSGLGYFWRLTRPGSIAISRGTAAASREAPYETWIALFDEAPERDRARHIERLASLSRRPLISILTVLQSADRDELERLARSVSGQIYDAWELVVAAPTQHHHRIASGLAAHGVNTASLRIVNGGASAPEDLNAALGIAQGEFVVPLAEGALLRPHALLELALTAAATPSAELIYSDEDAIDAAGHRTGWRFKPAWSPAFLDASNYIGNIALMRRETVRELGGWLATAADPQHDLLLRLTRQSDARSIVHLAKVLVHAGKSAAPPVTRVTHALPNPAPRVSLIIPTRDGADVLATCVRSIRALTRYDDYEIIIVDNGSVEEATKRLFVELAADPAIRILSDPEPFNFSRLNNTAAREATGTVLALINNDIEVTRGEWLAEMVALTVRPETGCVGAKLLYPDGRLQHGGVVIGLGGVAGHTHRFARAGEPGYLDRLRVTHNVSAVTAACLVVRKSVYDEVGGMDESLAVAFNDVDFCLKVRAAGYLNLWTPFAELVHHESASRGRDLTPAKARRFADEHAAMQRRWGAQLLQDPYYSPHLTYDSEDFTLRLR